MTGASSPLVALSKCKHQDDELDIALPQSIAIEFTAHPYHCKVRPPRPAIEIERLRLPARARGAGTGAWKGDGLRNRVAARRYDRQRSHTISCAPQTRLQRAQHVCNP